MKGFQKFVKQSWRFYLIVLIIVLFLVICDSVYICRDEKIAFTGKSIEQQITEQLDKAEQKQQDTAALPQGVCLYSIVEDKANNMEIMGFIMTIIGIMIFLGARQYYFADTRAAEFIGTLPVKKRSLVLYDYFSMLAVILIGGLVQAGILLGCQNRYNRAVVRFWEQRSAGVPEDNMVSLFNDRLLLYMGIYFLFILLVYTWIYIWMTVTRNPIAGEVISLFLYGGCCIAEGFFAWTMFPVNSYGIYGDMTRYYDIVDMIETLMSPRAFMENLDEVSGTVAGNNTWMMLALVGLVVLAGIVLLIIVSARRELSRGKLFYFSALNYLFAVLSGIILFAWLADDFLYDYAGLALVTGILGAVVIYILVRPDSGKKSVQWEVK